LTVANTGDKVIPNQTMKSLFVASLIAFTLSAAPVELASSGQPRGAVVISTNAGPLARRAATLLVSRVERKTGVKLLVQSAAPATGAAVVFATPGSRDLTGIKAPTTAELGEEGFALLAQGERLYVVAREGRGFIYGAGKILRTASYARGQMAPRRHWASTSR